MHISIMADKYFAVIAIDFGTIFSGYAFSMKGSEDGIKMNKSWGAEVGFEAYKTPTTVLIAPDGNFHSFGFEAENEFADMDDEEIGEGYQLFQRFKMELYKHKHLDTNIKIKSTSGDEKSALEIFANALRFLKTHSLEAISKPLVEPITRKEIRWVITVPAIWNDTAKKFMRLAAKKAGLVKSMISPNLIIALEPEAASFYCRTLAMDKFIGRGHERGVVSMKPGETYIIVDCGGGTIDITVHKVLNNDKVQEVDGASGGPWGGIYVDKKYHQLLDNIFGKDFMNHLKRHHPSVWFNMLKDFEIKKRKTSPGKKGGVNIVLSLQFAKAFEEQTGKDVEKYLKSKKPVGVKFASGMLRIAGERVAEMYSEVIPQIKSHLNKLIGDNNALGLTKMFVVGGFGECAFIQEFLKSEFGHRLQVLIPDDAGMSVLKGAVAFGHDTDTITSRVARFNYCVDGFRSPEENDDPSRIISIPGEEDTVHILETFVRKDQPVEIDEQIHRSYSPTKRNQNIITFNLYTTEADTDDPNHLRFGGTDISFIALDEASGNLAESKITL